MDGFQTHLTIGFMNGKAGAFPNGRRRFFVVFGRRATKNGGMLTNGW